MLYPQLPIQLVANLESFIALYADLTKLYCFFNHGNLAVLSCLALIQDSINTLKCEHFIEFSKCLKCVPPAFVYS